MAVRGNQLAVRNNQPDLSDPEVAEKLANAALPEERRGVQKGHGNRRKPQYDQWRNQNFRPGTQITPVASAAVATGHAEAPSLDAWLDRAGFHGFAGTGSIFGSIPVPKEYSSLVDDLVYLGSSTATKVQVWPIRIDLGAVAEERDFITLYYYTSPEGMHAIAGLLTRGANGLAVYDAIEQDSRSARQTKLDREREREQQYQETHKADDSSEVDILEFNGFAATVLEPSKFERRRDVLFDRLGEDHWPPGSALLEAAGKCLPLRVPIHVLEIEDEHEPPLRPDRVLVLGDRLRPFLEAGTSVLGGRRDLHHVVKLQSTSCTTRTTMSIMVTMGSMSTTTTRLSTGELKGGDVAGDGVSKAALAGPEDWEVDVPKHDLASLRQELQREARRPNSSMVLAPRKAADDEDKPKADKS
eukprot:CAMPEP_0115368404 /NCGR_PEP_ID=MMETSP0270-20121206/105801_1 /TAXON_ID=71861 /ORGANISM="Scrippsiella trochoidea, Strain CCMP3099" /LENGTH=413 /DNA_ID=CAMNT_0002791201 /DNA_START=46 /DNA_END=1288 /DNA_ORIENTATION=+